jgi:hypothetical protein
VPSQVVIRLKHPAPDPAVRFHENPAVEFWSAAKNIPNPTSADIAGFEAQLKNEFPQTLRERFIRYYLSPSGSTSADSEKTSTSDTELTKILGKITFSIESIRYGSPVLNLDMAITHLAGLLGFFGITPDDALQVLALQAPGALNQVLATNVPWEPETVVRSLGELASIGNQPTAIAGAAFNARLQTLINAAWSIPFVAALGVLVLLILEVSNRLHSYDTEILSIKSAEITRADARVKAFDKYTSDLLTRYDKIIAQYAEPPKAAEVTRLDQRVGSFEKQMSELSSKVETIAKQQAELAKQLQQRAGQPNTGKSRGGRGRRSGRNRG